ncbi:SDR family oxidoreductase [Clostridium paridis]|uniref:SDR family oxidoreductase n=1 Tax=Clostridium paridis TaxID=2803863 RepID=A0A937FHL4_9CLOT|nr:SDR family oxidoreductase [Clostridium paridis]MBL4933529.1 SDR family oxidoreductase [Clostridium paridis]
MNKTVLITGASSGLGKATAKMFAKQGWNVIATMRSPEKEKELTSFQNVLVTRLNVLDNQSILNAVEEGIKCFGKIDVLVNNAGYGQYGLFEAVSQEDIRKQFETNVFGLMEVTRILIPHFKGKNGGIIINISSCGGLIGLPAISIYNSSKFAVEGFSESLSYELASQGIVVKVVEPGGFSSNFHTIAAEKRPELAELSSYAKYLKDADDFYSMLVGHRDSAEDIANVVYKAATDERNQFRYIIASNVQNLVDARIDMDYQEFTDFMRTKLNQK